MSIGMVPSSLVLGWLLLGLCSAVGPPQQVGAYQSRQIAKVGQPKKKFLCPVEAEPAPFIQWFKDGESVTEIWERFRIIKEGSLRIKDISLEDAGKYVCKATNGFGVIFVNYSLIVIDKDSGFVNPGESDLPPDEDQDPLQEGALPKFVDEQKMVRKNRIVRPVNSTVRLKCRAIGNPMPQIRWEKGGREIMESAEAGWNDSKQKWTLKLRDLQETDTGDYQCVVSNLHGAINFTYSLEVIGKIRTKPTLIGPHPLNESVVVGDTATFRCKVKSVVRPHIQWLKRMDKESEMESNETATIEVKSQKFVVLKTQEVWMDSEGFYVNKLVIKNVSPIDAGMYICLGANQMGYSFRSAFLTMAEPADNADVVINQGTQGDSSRNLFELGTSSFDSGTNNFDSGSGSGRKGDSHHDDSSDSSSNAGNSLPLIIAIPACVAIVLVTLAIFILQRRRRCNAHSNTHRTTRFNAVPTQERDTYQTPVHSNPNMIPPMGPMGPIGPPSSRAASDKMSKLHNSDYYSEISSVSRCHHQQSQQPLQHNSINQYGGY